MRVLTEDGYLLRTKQYKIVTEKHYIYIYVDEISDPIYTFIPETELGPGDMLVYTGLRVHEGKYDDNNKNVIKPNSQPMLFIPDTGEQSTLCNEIYSAIFNHLYPSYVCCTSNKEVIREYTKNLLENIIEW